MPKFFQAIYETARQTKPDALVEFCPWRHGLFFLHSAFPEHVSCVDPESAWQVRLKGKTLKALQGDAIAYFGDHVDMTKDDFRLHHRVGGVVGTNFTWPEGSAEKKRGDLTPAREKELRKVDWHLQRRNALSRRVHRDAC